MTAPEAWSEAQTSTTLSVDGHDVSVAYYEAGAEHDGPPVVFLHGIPTWSYLWRDVAPAVAEDRHVVAPDLVGYGNSSMADGFDRSIRAQEQVLSVLLSTLGTARCDLVAHDIGGGVALRYASHRPADVRRLVLSNAACYDSWPVEFVNGLGVPGALTELDDEAFESKLDFVFGEGLYGDAADHEAFVEGMKAPWRTSEGRTSLERNAVATNTNHTTELDYGAVTAETLLLWGADDVLQPLANAERLAADVSGNAAVDGLDEAYHWVVEDRTTAYRRRLRSFLVD
ncbi:alpha/beta fold hydrolase [Haloplanus sp. GCM10025708]|uniref:alpha/beta fold hydrolase n=1 Tax=Haloferacaceae TaxID=1644056 RepID=UPI00361CB16F